MRVDGIKQAPSGNTGRFMPDEAPAGATARKTESRALVVTTPAVPQETHANYRQAAFLAHLIATKEHAPQTRERRRAEPYEAIAAYRAVAALASA